MAHFAILDKENKVIFVTVVANEKIILNDQEQEKIGIDFLFETIKIKNIFPNAETAKQTSYNSSFRNKFASIGDTFSEDINAFISTKPTNGNYIWNEEKLQWEEIKD